MNQINRRKFLQNSSLAAAGFWIGSASAFGRNKISPSEKLNIGVIGTANRAAANITGVKGQNIVALCDIDDTYLNAMALKFPEAKKYNDFRKMLEQKDIDAVVVSTPDHTHAVATLAVLNSGRHVYCEKPLAHTVAEVRKISETARKTKLVSQMGTQIHAGNNYRRVVELIQTGAIGEVKECHVWCGRSQTATLPTENPPIPKNVHWDLWIGPVPERRYNPIYHPKKWRGFWHFGSGTLGDMACHYMDLVFWALKLQSPLTIESEGPAVHPELTPDWLIVRWEYAAREKMPPVKVTWYDGDKKPDLVTSGKVPAWNNGILFVGEKGMLLAEYGKYMLLPEETFKDFTAPAPFIPDSIGHHEEWILACKTGGKTTCNFDYAGALSEAVLLGNVAYRAGEKLEWDSRKFKVTNTRSADKFLKSEYRSGWKV